MKILLADKINPVAIDAFKAINGAEVVSNPTLTADDLPNNLADVDVLVVRSTKVTKAAFEAAPKLGLVVRAGSGVNTIDVACATEHNVRVCNCPGKNSAAVAELAMGLLLSLERRIPDCVAQLRAGKWNKKEFGKAQGLKGKTIGVVGAAGQIGRELIQRLRGFDVNFVGYDVCLTPELAEKLGIERCESLIDVAKKADVVSIHVPLMDATRGMINAEFIAAMRPGSILLNTSRAEVVDNEALLKALDGGLRCGLDVYPGEPGTAQADFDCALAKHPNCYGTHHIGASTEQAEKVTGLEAARLAKLFAEKQTLPNCVNPAK